MLKADTNTIKGRQALIDHAIHESHLEGHEVSQLMRSLCQQYIAGTMTLEEVKQARLKSINKVA